MIFLRPRGGCLLTLCLLIACAPTARQRTTPATSVGSLRLIGEVIVPFNQLVGNTLFGGISGVDMAPDGTWYLLSDDKGTNTPARFYKGRMRFDTHGFYAVDIQSVHTLQQPAGTDPNAYVDPESIRFDKRTHTLYWTSEGSRALLLDPFVREMDTTGAYLRQLPTPALFRFRQAAVGPRQNETYEGMTLAPDGRRVWVLMEGPLQQDRPDTAAPTAPYPNRFSCYDRRTGALQRQVVYQLDAVTTPGHVNRISEVLALSDTEFLTLECSYYQGENRVRVYAIDTRGATDVRKLSTLYHATYQPVRKRLVADLTQQIHPLDNLECLAFGPTLPNGHRTLLMVADNNFNAKEINQFLAFEILPD